MRATDCTHYYINNIRHSSVFRRFFNLNDFPTIKTFKNNRGYNGVYRLGGSKVIELQAMVGKSDLDLLFKNHSIVYDKEDFCTMVMAHEIVHYKQEIENRLLVSEEEFCIKWEGKDMYLPDIPYFERPWEKEANKLSFAFVEYYKKSINK